MQKTAKQKYLVLMIPHNNGASSGQQNKKKVMGRANTIIFITQRTVLFWLQVESDVYYFLLAFYHLPPNRTIEP